MPEFIPAILPTSEEDLKKKASELPEVVDLFHLDVLEHDVWTEVPKSFEAHLMVQDPEEIFSMWIDRGARRIITHKISDEILSYRGQVEIGLAFDLDIPIETVLAEADYADFVHLMSIAEIGEQGHPLDPRIFDRIEAIQKEFPDLPISVDGGVTKENFQQLIDAGADRLVVGSHFKDLWSSLTNKS